MEHGTDNLRKILADFASADHFAVLTIEDSAHRGAWPRTGLLLVANVKGGTDKVVKVFGTDMAGSGSGGPAQLSTTLHNLKDAGYRSPLFRLLDEEQFRQVEGQAVPFDFLLRRELSALANEKHWGGVKSRLEEELRKAGY